MIISAIDLEYLKSLFKRIFFSVIIISAIECYIVEMNISNKKFVQTDYRFL